MPEYRILVQEIHRDAMGNILRVATKFEHDVQDVFPLAALAQVWRSHMSPEGPQFSGTRKPAKTPALTVRSFRKAKKAKPHGANLPKPGLGQW